MALPPDLQALSDPGSKGTSTRWILGCLAGSFLLAGIAGAILLPLFQQTSSSAQTELCSTNLYKLAAASFMYAQDNNDSLPGAAWMDQISLYQDDPVRFACPVQRRMDPSTYGYAFNKNLIGTSLGKVKEPSTTEMIFDSTLTQRNAVGELNTLPPSGRHHQGRKNVIVYADGRTKALERLGP